MKKIDGSYISSSDEIGIRLRNSRNIIGLCSEKKMQNDIALLTKSIIEYKEENGNLFFPLCFEKADFESGDIIFRGPDKNTKNILKDICTEYSICSKIENRGIDTYMDWKNGEVSLLTGLVLMGLTSNYSKCINTINHLNKSFDFIDGEMLLFRKLITAVNLDYIALERICPRINVLQKTATNVANATLDDIAEKESGPIFALESDGDLVTLEDDEPRNQPKIKGK